MDIKTLFATQKDQNKLIAELKAHRNTDEPDTGDYKAQLDPLKHEVYNRVTRPDKRVKVDPADPNASDGTTHVTSGGNEEASYRMEPVARIALALQKLIVKRAVSFLFGNAVTLDSVPEGDGEKTVLKALNKVMYDVKAKSFNRKIARMLFQGTEVAEVWYPVARNHKIYGFDSKFKLKCGILSPMLGDTLYPYFDENGDMVAFSRSYSITKSNVSINYFETYTDDLQFLWVQGSQGYELVEGYPKTNIVGKIPVIYGNQEQVEWADVQNLIERLEKLLSNFADTNDYHAAPKIFVKGHITGFSKKGESGAIIEGDEGSEADYLSWDNAPESVKLEIETLLRMIYTLTQTPDISFESVKGIGAISGLALKLLFMDAHLKVADHQEVFDEYLQRRINVVKAFIGKFNTRLEADAENLMVEPVIKPYMIVDEAAEMKIWSDANGGNAVMSQKASFTKAGMTSDPDADFEQYQAEQDSLTQRQNSFVLNEPTPA